MIQIDLKRVAVVILVSMLVVFFASRDHVALVWTFLAAYGAGMISGIVFDGVEGRLKPKPVNETKKDS